MPTPMYSKRCLLGSGAGSAAGVAGADATVPGVGALSSAADDAFGSSTSVYSGLPVGPATSGAATFVSDTAAGLTGVTAATFGSGAAAGAAGEAAGTVAAGVSSAAGTAGTVGSVVFGLLVESICLGALVVKLLIDFSIT